MQNFVFPACRAGSVFFSNSKKPLFYRCFFTYLPAEFAAESLGVLLEK
jgi:hypothetical protein